IFFNLFFLSPLLQRGLPPGGDGVSHFNLVINTVDLIQTHTLNWWSPDYNLGFPLFNFYAPLSYFFIGLIYVFTHLDLLFLFKLSIFLSFGLFPLVIYKSMRLMEFSQISSLFSALVSTMLSSYQGFGLEIVAFFKYGIYSQVMVLIFFPLTIAFIYRFFFIKNCKNEITFFKVSVFLSLTFLTHFLSGFMAALTAVPALFLKFNKLKLKKILFLAFCTFCFVAFLLIPIYFYGDYMNDGKFSHKSFDRIDGYGVSSFFHFFSGNFLDFGRLPFLTFFAVLGILISFHFRQEDRHKFILAGFCLSFFFLIGRALFGNLINFIPGVSAIPLFRFISLLHFFSIILIGVAFGFLIDLISSKFRLHRYEQINLLIVLLVCVFFLAPVVIDTSANYVGNVVTFHDVGSEPDLNQIMNELNLMPNSRVIFENFSSYSMIPNSIPIYSNKPSFFSGGIGGHDSLSIFYVNKPFISFSNKTDLYNLFNLGYFISNSNRTNLTDFYFKNKNYVIFNKTSSSYFDLVQSSIAIDSSLGDSRPIFLMWYFSVLPSTNEHILILKPRLLNELTSITEHIDLNFLIIPPERSVLMKNYQSLLSEDRKRVVITDNSFNIDVKNLKTHELTTVDALHFFQTFKSVPKNCGSVIGGTEVVRRGYYETLVNVTDSSCFIMLKVSAHPEWRAYVNGTESEIYEISPSFMSVKVDTPGVYKVYFEYKLRALRIGLFFFSLFSFILVFIFRKKLGELIKK
ncbi:hypothetical protein HN415_01145, partial [Candidatus Woesearchaeota archaeon]|nr:hypothetical protein [Candidatus Woesearchaeota archaeon]